MVGTQNRQVHFNVSCQFPNLCIHHSFLHYALQSAGLNRTCLHAILCFYQVHSASNNLSLFIFSTKLIIKMLSQYLANVFYYRFHNQHHDFGSPALNTYLVHFYVEFVFPSLAAIGLTRFLMLLCRTGVLEPGIQRAQGLADVASNSASSIVCCYSKHNQVNS